MRLHDQWRKIAKRAWSFRLALVAGILTGIEAILPFFGEQLPPRPMAILTFFIIAGALVARLVAQKDF